VKQEQLPIFVYGTLLEGYGNWEYFLKGKTERVVSGFISGFDMYSVGAFPCIKHSSIDRKVYGELMYVEPELYDQVLSRVDSLEGYHKGRYSKQSMYLRKKVSVRTECGDIVQAWVYVWNRPGDLGNRIKSGSWDEYCRDAHRYLD
jgi:gamma-glutamylcyclotransferase (GGCT)/AIG2-like uncharacterized protein YtfP